MPWHDHPWVQLSQTFRSGRLPHAILIQGPKGVGKSQLALRLLNLILCQEEEVNPCGRCRSCHLFSVETHPSAWVLRPKEPNGIITIDAVRELVTALSLTVQQGAAKAAIIDPAEAMNRSALNALLKTLEEPPGESYLILVSHAVTELPATIRSRCVAVPIQVPTAEEAQEWLGRCAPEAITLLPEAGGAPLEAMRLNETGLGLPIADLRRDLTGLSLSAIDPVETAAKWRRETETGIVVNTVARLIHSVIRLKFGLAIPSSPEQRVLTTLAERLEFPLVFEMSDRLKQMKADLHSGFNLNEQLMLEELAVRWANLTADQKVTQE